MSGKKLPRLVLAGTNSGCGKTTVTCALLSALVQRGLQVGAFKCGPDYIDPMFHSRVIGAKTSNLDPYFFSEETLKALLLENGADRDVSIIEGVMGYYDGLSMDSLRASTCQVAQWTDSPTVLVVGAHGAARSVLAVVEGFLHFAPENRIQGVILNRCTGGTYGLLKQEILRHFGGRVQPLGFLPDLPDCSLESRHLGLVTAAEVTNLREKLSRLAAEAEKSIELDALLRLADSAPELNAPELELPRLEPVRIAVARDLAFCFYYEDSLAVLQRLGAELVEFSPLRDAALPEHIHGLYLGGGYPELYARQLSDNGAMRRAVGEAVAGGLPCIAECGGFMYLTGAIAGSPMVGALPGECRDTGHLVRFGYVRLRAKADNLLCRAGEEIPGHEFHHWDCTQPGSDYLAQKESGRSWPCAVATPTLYAGFPHFHFRANPAFALNFYQACVKEKRSHA